MKIRLWSLVMLTVFMSMIMVGTVSAATPFTDIEGTVCEEAVDVLYSLDLIEGRTEDVFAPHINLTRAELSTIIMRLMKLENSVGTGGIFSDVDTEHWACGNIEAAYGMGIIKGMGDGTFMPDAEVTYAQAIKMFVCTLGYEVHAEASGGYPGGYMAKASQLGLLKGVAAAGADVAITRADMAVMMYNTLGVNLLQETSFGAGASGGYAEAEGKTLLSEYRGIYEVKGLVTANYYTALKTSESKVGKGYVAIDGKVFYAGESDAENLLGYEVKAYYTVPDATEIPEIVYVSANSGVNSVTVSSAYIDEEETTKINLEYKTQDGAVKSFAIDNGATLVLNGLVKDEWTKADMIPALGTVTVIDNRSENDVIIVEAYVNYVVKSVNSISKTILFKEGTPLVVDPADTSKKINLIGSNGEAIEIDALSQWNILSVAKSADNKIIKAVKSDVTVSGKVTESDAEEVVIAGVKYNVDASLPNGSLIAPSLNMTAVYSLDFMGNIAAVDIDSATTYKYGYLVGAKNKKGIGGIGQFKIFTEDGQMLLMDAAEKVLLNGTVYNASEVVENIPLKTVWGTPTDGTGMNNGKKVYPVIGETIRQLIRYVANDENTLVKEIETAADVTAIPMDYAGDAGFNMVVELAANAAPMTPSSVLPNGYIEEKVSANASSSWNGQYAYREGGMSNFAGKYAVDANTKFFVIPEEDKPDSEYKLHGKLAHHDVYPGAMFYDLTEGNVISAIVWDKGAAAAMGGASSTLKVEYPASDADKRGMFVGMSKAIDSEGEEITKIRVLHTDKTEKTLVVRDNFAFGAWITNTNLAIDTVLKNRQASGSKFSAQTTPTTYLLASELKYGDIINYTTDMTDTYIETGAVLMRSSTPGLYEAGFNVNRFLSLYEDLWYAGGDLLASGTVRTVSPTSMVLETAFAKADGTPGNPVIRTMSKASSPLVIALNVAEGTHEFASFDDVVEGDTYAMVWTTVYPEFFIIYR